MRWPDRSRGAWHVPRSVQKIKFRHQGDEQDGATAMVYLGWAGCFIDTKEHRRRLLHVERGLFEDVEYDARSRGIERRGGALRGGGRERGLGLPVSLSRVGGQLGVSFQHTDRVCVLAVSIACTGICQRTGLGKVRHLEVASDLTRTCAEW